MDYLNSLQCKTDPFASMSGAEIFLSQSSRDSIEKLTHYILLGAGLHLVIGPDGLGKTTLLNQLSQKFSADSKTAVLLLNNPQFSNLQQFLLAVTGVFKTIKPPSDVDDATFQKAFNSFFHKLCQQEKKTVLLLIDNGHNLPEFCLQALNSFYDHHPDCRRFLQIVICGEPSLRQKINANKPLSSRVAFTARLKPFSFKDTRKLIRFHVERSASDQNSPPTLFSIPAQWIIYRLTKGHPKATVDLCHFIVLTLVIEKQKKAGWFMTLRCAKQLIPKRAKKLQLIRTVSLSSLIVLMLVFGLWSEQIKTLNMPQLSSLPKVFVAEKKPSPKLQQMKPATVAQKTTPPKEVKVAPPEEIKVAPPEEVKVAQPEEAQIIKETPPAIPTEEQVAVVEPAEKSAAAPEKPQEKQAVAEAPVSKSGTDAAEPAITETKQTPKVETIVTPTIRERREVKPGDTFLGMIQQVYGPSYVKTQYIDQVIAANPHLKDPHNLEIGDQVFFPVFAQEDALPVVAVKVPETQVVSEAVQETQPIDSSDISTRQQVEPPEYLGEIITAKGETFGDMIRRIYGPWSFNPENVKKVMAVNPDLKSPELLFVGFKIRFPTIPVALTPKAEEVWWVKVTAVDDIQSAYRFLRRYRKSAPPLLIIPSRTDTGQVIMNILLEDFFIDKGAAQKAILDLPPAMTETAETLHGLSPNIYYYRKKQEE